MKRSYILTIFAILLSVTVISTYLYNELYTKEDKLRIQQGSFEDPKIRVRLLNFLGNVNELSFDVKGEYTINQVSIAPNKPYRLKIENGQLVVYEGTNKLYEGSHLILEPTEYKMDNQVRINTRPYLGTIQFTIEGPFIRPINTLPLEDYLKGVVPYEMPASWPIEALKVQAIAARTYAMTQITKIIDDSINYQVYAGYTWHSNSTRAVNETRGQTLWHNGRLAYTFYTSTNGGVTEANANVWGGTLLPYLPVKEDPYDAVHAWSFRLNKQQISLKDKDLYNPDSWWNSAREIDSTICFNIKTWLARNGFPNSEIKIVAIPLLNFSPVKTSGGRVLRGDLTVQFMQKSTVTNDYIRNEDGSIRITQLEMKNTTAQRIRSMIGIIFIRSYLVDSVMETPELFTVSGRGYGHGVGMSQWGARRMAEQGLDHKNILDFYYPGSILSALESTILTEEQPKPKVSPRPSRHIRLTIDKKEAIVDENTLPLLEAPYVDRSRTLIPMRFVSEQLGARVNWDSQSRTITITDNSYTLTLRAGSRNVLVNGKEVTIDVPPSIVRGTTFVPLRFVTEQLNGIVTWDPTDRSVKITRAVPLIQSY